MEIDELDGMSLVAGVKCLVQQPMETNTGTSNPDREKSTSTDDSSHEGDCSLTVEGVAGQDLCFSDDVVTTRDIETMNVTCLESMKWWRPGPSRLVLFR